MPVSVVTMLAPDPRRALLDDDIAAWSGGQDSPSAVRAVKAHATTGVLVREWSLILDAGNVLNVDNEPIDPNTVNDALSSLRDEELLLSYRDHTGSVFKDETVTTTVKIQDATLVKLAPESPWVLQITVREVV